MNKIINVIGGGLAGSEASLYLANHGYKVNLYEQKPIKMSPAHHSDFQSKDQNSTAPFPFHQALQKQAYTFPVLMLQTTSRLILSQQE